MKITLYGEVNAGHGNTSKPRVQFFKERQANPNLERLRVNASVFAAPQAAAELRDIRRARRLASSRSLKREEKNGAAELARYPRVPFNHNRDWVGCTVATIGKLRRIIRSFVLAFVRLQQSFALDFEQTRNQLPRDV
jgi:hypothetical protein